MALRRLALTPRMLLVVLIRQLTCQRQSLKDRHYGTRIRAFPWLTVFSHPPSSASWYVVYAVAITHPLDVPFANAGLAVPVLQKLCVHHHSAYTESALTPSSLDIIWLLPGTTSKIAGYVLSGVMDNSLCPMLLAGK